MFLLPPGAKLSFSLPPGAYKPFGFAELFLIVFAASRRKTELHAAFQRVQTSLTALLELFLIALAASWRKPQLPLPPGAHKPYALSYPEALKPSGFEC